MLRETTRTTREGEAKPGREDGAAPPKQNRKDDRRRWWFAFDGWRHTDQAQEFVLA